VTSFEEVTWMVGMAAFGPGLRHGEWLRAAGVGRQCAPAALCGALLGGLACSLLAANAALCNFRRSRNLLLLNGRDLTAEPLTKRREQLQKIIAADPVLRLSQDLPGSVADIIKTLRAAGIEGVIAKRKESPYQPGDRSGDWDGSSNPRRFYPV
jgi:hypothetical protein